MAIEGSFMTSSLFRRAGAELIDTYVLVTADYGATSRPGGCYLYQLNAVLRLFCRSSVSSCERSPLQNDESYRRTYHEHRQTEADNRTRYQRQLGLLFTKRAGSVLHTVRKGIMLRQC
jgi:hypothetical protein